MKMPASLIDRIVAAARRVVALPLLVALLLAACGQPVPGAGADPTGTASVVALATQPPGTPGTPLVSLTAMPGTPTAAPPQATPTQTPTLRPTLPPSGAVPGLADALANVTGFRLQDDWTGLSPIAPLVAHYDFTRQGEGFVGTAQFEVAGYSKKPPLSADRAITIPPDAAQAFFAILAGTPARPGQYKPRVEHTDDYPKLGIVLMTAQGAVNFVSESQGDHTPWGLQVGGTAYIVDTDAPSRALAALLPYLEYETLDLLIDEASYGGASTPPAGLALCAGVTSASPQPTPAAPATAPRGFVAEYGLDRAYSLVITGAGVATIARERKLVRDPEQLAALLAALGEPTPSTSSPPRYNGDIQNSIYLTWRTSDGREVRVYFDPVVGTFSVYDGQAEKHYWVPRTFTTTLRDQLCR